jgi:hypothetical protein
MTSLKDFADIATSFGVILGIPLALYGIDAWRREAMWKRRSELCEEVLALCYETKEIISYMRSPGGFSGEGETRQPDKGEPDDVRRSKNLAWIPIERHNQHIEKLSRLWALSYRFRAQFSIEATQPIEDLRNIIGSVKSAAHILSIYWTTFNWDVMTPEQFQSNRALQDKYEAIMWEGMQTVEQVNGIAPDEIQAKVDDAVRRIEKTCHEVLHAQHTLFGMLNVKLRSIRRDSSQ